MKTIWIVSGEASGDDYGAGLARALRALEPDIQLKGMGSEKMRSAGVELFVDSTELGLVGIVEVFRHIPFFIRLMKDMVKRAERERPDAVVLIDYPGFNVRIAQKLKAIGIRVVYYISPQVWAWKKGRIPKIAASVARMLCIFPFEPSVYDGTGLDARFVGHPLLETLRSYTDHPVEREKDLVILLPGSRRSEYSRLMPLYMETVRALRSTHPHLRFHIPMRSAHHVEAVKRLISETDSSFDISWFEFSYGDAREWLCRGIAGIAASGTITVESTILGLPLVVTYKLHPFTYWYASKLVKLNSVTIANLVTERTVFEEYLQGAATSENLSSALLNLLPGGSRREEALSGMRECVRLLGDGENVAENVARNVLEVAELS